jgi:hypothetical protein
MLILQANAANTLGNVLSEIEILLLVAELMQKIRSLVKTIKNSTNLLRYIRMKQLRACTRL